MVSPSISSHSFIHSFIGNKYHLLFHDDLDRHDSEPFYGHNGECTQRWSLKRVTLSYPSIIWVFATIVAIAIATVLLARRL